MSKHFEVTALILDKRGRVISIGHNSYVKTHPLQAKYAKQVGREHKIYLHAEMDAVIKAGSKIKDAETIQVFRYDSDGEPVNACPCPICKAMLKQTPITNILHT